MSFRFRRRGDVNEQSPQQEPFFQNATGQQPYVDSSAYPQMGQPQGFDPRFNNGFGQQQAQQTPQGQHPGYAQEDVRSLSFWQETQANAGFEDPESDAEANSPIRLLVAVAGVALIAGLSWFAYKWAKSPSSDTPPLIHADAGPHKVSPDHRGGLNIPYQDKLIYDRIGDNVNEEPVERLLPPPEIPSDMSQQPIDQNQQTVQQQPMQTDGQQQMQQPMQQGQMSQQAIASQQMNTQPQQQQPAVVPTLPAATPATVAAQSTATEIEPEIIKKPKPEATIKGTYFVQMATVKSEEAALREWKRLQAKHSLKGMKSQIKESETTDGDTVFRLLMGPFEEKVKAQKYAVKMDGTKVVQITE